MFMTHHETPDEGYSHCVLSA